MKSHWRIFATRGFAIFVGFVLCAEVLLRLEPVENFLPPPRPYHSDEVEIRRRVMRQLQREKGPIEVLFQGNSTTRTSISPLLFDSVFAHKTGRSIISYNGSLSGLPPVVVNFFLQHFYLPRLRPQVVVEGVNLAGLRRPVPTSEWERFTSGTLERAWRGTSVADRLRAFGMESSRILYRRGFLASSLSLERPLWAFANFPMDERGFEVRIKSILEIPGRGNFGPYPTGAFPIEPALAGIRRSAELCRQLGIEYVLVRVPEHANRFQGREALYREYRERLIEFTREHDIRYVDVVGEDLERWANDELYSDATHMSAAGARLFTTLFAEAWASAGVVNEPLVER